jgi:hypothetical protein
MHMIRLIIGFDNLCRPIIIQFKTIRVLRKGEKGGYFVVQRDTTANKSCCNTYPFCLFYHLIFGWEKITMSF